MFWTVKLAVLCGLATVFSPLDMWIVEKNSVWVQVKSALKSDFNETQFNILLARGGRKSYNTFHLIFCIAVLF